MDARQRSGWVVQILKKICGEYLEMPGLHLTCGQAEQLWNLDPSTCKCLLDVLVELRFLARAKDGAYWRLRGGSGASLPCGPRAFSC